ncbi:MAG: hypothetical protein PHN72_03665 [Bacilli bacterium]|nr:hypothetical protein [Bacilli bacterium]
MEHKNIPNKKDELKQNRQVEIYEFKQNLKRLEFLLAILKAEKNTVDAEAFALLWRKYENLLDEQDKKFDFIRKYPGSFNLAKAQMRLLRCRTELSNIVIERENAKKEREFSKRQAAFLGYSDETEDSLNNGNKQKKLS